MLTRDYQSGELTEILAESANKNEIKLTLVKDSVPVAEWTE